MVTVADCLRQHAAGYLDRFRDRVPLGHRQVIAAITRCRTGQLGGTVYQCDGCGRQHWVGRSCGNRHCPTCQHDKTAAWLDKQTKRLLPVDHFLVTFTVPQELRMLLRANQRAGYDALFHAGSQTIRDLAANPRYLGTGRIGFFGVLHTWGRDPTVYHPHVHFVVPAGGVSEDGRQWLATPKGFLFPHAVVCQLYKARFADALREAGWYDRVPAEVWQAQWVVQMTPVGNGQAVLKYLAPYVYRVAISDNRIESCTEKEVTFRYTPSGQKQSLTRTVTGEQFVRGFLQHVLPRSFQKIRYYGWMGANSRMVLDDVRWLVWLYLGWTYWLASGHVVPDKKPPRPPVRCAACGSPMRITLFVVVSHNGLWSHSVPYLDSG